MPPRFLMGTAAMASTREEQLAARSGSTLSCHARDDGVGISGRFAGIGETLDAAANAFVGMCGWDIGIDGTLAAAANALYAALLLIVVGEMVGSECEWRLSSLGEAVVLLEACTCRQSAAQQEPLHKAFAGLCADHPRTRTPGHISDTVYRQH